MVSYTKSCTCEFCKCISIVTRHTRVDLPISVISFMPECLKAKCDHSMFVDVFQNEYLNECCSLLFCKIRMNVCVCLHISCKINEYIICIRFVESACVRYTYFTNIFTISNEKCFKSTTDSWIIFLLFCHTLRKY